MALSLRQRGLESGLWDQPERDDECKRDYGDIIQLAQHRDEVRNDVKRHHQVPDGDHKWRFGVPGDRLVSQERTAKPQLCSTGQRQETADPCDLL